MNVCKEKRIKLYIYKSSSIYQLNSVYGMRITNKSNDSYTIWNNMNKNVVQKKNKNHAFIFRAITLMVIISLPVIC